MTFSRDEYSLVRGSDLERDGMFLEVSRVDKPGAPLAEYFYSDVDGSLTLTVYVEGLPADLLTWFHEKANQHLVPS